MPLSASRFNRLGTDGKTEEANAADSSTGVAEAGQLVALDSTGRLDPSLLPVGFGEDIKTIVASEDLSAGDFVNVFDNAGVANVQLADRTNGRKADGFVLEAVSTGAPASVFFEGVNTALTGLTIGVPYFLGTAGDAELTPTTASGEILQCLGTSCGATELAFERSDPITRA